MPPGYDPHVVAAALVACLASLRDPLFPVEHYQAVLACGSLDAKLKADAASAAAAATSAGGDGNDDTEGDDDAVTAAASSRFDRSSGTSAGASGTAGAGARNLSALLMALPAANKATLAVLGRTLHNLTTAHGDGNKSGSSRGSSSGGSALGNDDDNNDDDGALDFLDMSDGPLSPMSPKAATSSSSSSPPRLPANGTTPLLLGLVFAPALLRSDQDDLDGYDHQSAVAAASSAGNRNLDRNNGDDDDDDDDSVVGSAKALGEGGGDAVKLLVAEWPTVGAALEAEQADLKRQLAHKCLKLEAYQADLQVRLGVVVGGCLYCDV